MMSQWKLTLAYHGQDFHGWQVQPGLPTVQGTLRDALRQITREEVLPQGAGRTDAGVHALAQVASFALHVPIPPARLQRALNRILPASVRVVAAETVTAEFHARHSARGKIYEYRLFERRLRPDGDASAGLPLSSERICSPFLAPFVWDCRWPLHLGHMRAAAALLPGTHDFSAMAASARPDRETKLATAEPPKTNSPQGSPDAPPFSSTHSSTQSSAAGSPNPVKTIFQAHWDRQGDLLVFRIHGSGFLHHMVRNLVGTMVDIGRGSLQVDDLPRILATRDRAQAGPTAPASGLYLAEVLYPSPALDDTKKSLRSGHGRPSAYEEKP